MIETVQSVELICDKCLETYTALVSNYRPHRKYCDTCRKKVNSEKGTKSKRQVVVSESVTVISGIRQPKNNYRDKYPDWYNAGFVAGTYGYLRDRFRELYIQYRGMMIEARDALYQEEQYKAEIKGLDEDERCAWLLGFINQAIDGELNRQIC